VDSPIELALPLPNGGYGTFRIVESPVMEPGLAARYPQIRPISGRASTIRPPACASISRPRASTRKSWAAPKARSTSIPFQPGDLDHYIAYRKRDHVHGTRGVCEVTGEKIGSAEDTAKHLAAKVASGGTLRTYRLALAATGEYTLFHGGTVLDGLSAVITTMNRVDGIYEREVSVRMVLVANNDLLIYTNAATDPYANTSNDLNATSRTSTA
jgi:hypothetical protein